jgi:ubiquinone biosynthesis protein
MSSGIGIEKLLQATPRLAQIIGALARHGFVHAVDGEHRLPPPEEMRKAFEELGVVFLKFGQVLALRRDLLPDNYVAELERLQDRLPPMGFADARATIEKELGAPLAKLFASFDETPLAAATIAQVHEAILFDGRHVVVKVRRPNLDAIIKEDIAALAYLAAAAENLSPGMQAMDLTGLVNEFNESLRREMDFLNEARTMQRFRRMLKDSPDVWIPEAVMERTTGAVLTMEHSPGERLDSYAVVHPDAARGLAESLGLLMLRSVFANGLFHADPHPGNVFVLSDRRLCLHDFGMAGELGDQMRGSLTHMLEAMVEDDVKTLTDAYLELVVTDGNLDRAALERDIGSFLATLRGSEVGDLSIGDTFQSLMRIGSRHGIRNSGSFLLLTRAFLITEAVMLQLDPKINLVEIARAELPRIIAKRYSPAHLAEEGLKLTREIERFVREAPGDARRALKRLAEGDLGRVSAPNVETLAHRVSRDVERLTGAIASAALVIGGALLIAVEGWHRWFGDALIIVGVLGTFAVAFGALLKRGERTG